MTKEQEEAIEMFKKLEMGDDKEFINARETILSMLQEKDKAIDLMAEKLAEYEFEEMCAEAEIYHIGYPKEDDLDGYMKCIKRYFENKAKEVE